KHEDKIIKGYTFSNLYPFEKDKIYKKDTNYIFYIHIFNREIALRLKSCLEQEECIEDVTLKIKKFKKISQISSYSPCTSQIPGENYKQRYWTCDMSIAKLLIAINSNITKKYNLFYEKDERDLNFIQSISIKTKGPVPIKYKGGTILGYQTILTVKDDEKSQLLANLCIATGLGEKNSLGFGFCGDNGGVWY
ncbi:CRISPR-associated endoribonuclease Cas6, partial [Thomasclavelia cocleata]|uniref:CRISPR-associated endoribonuclease Cas6 n=1 Tax=Thomasclavelia cocleata TaxID=69824 RepID=UPI00256F35E1